MVIYQYAFYFCPACGRAVVVKIVIVDEILGWLSDKPQIVYCFECWSDMPLEGIVLRDK